MINWSCGRERERETTKSDGKTYEKRESLGIDLITNAILAAITHTHIVNECSILMIMACDISRIQILESFSGQQKKERNETNPNYLSIEIFMWTNFFCQFFQKTKFLVNHFDKKCLELMDQSLPRRRIK